jgi:tetratricopeptide (TPR) repeat protein
VGVPEPLKIFISSPGDVKDERRRAALVITRLKREFARFYDISPVLWEYEPMLSSGNFQDVIDPPADADILVLILWSRLGTPLPERTAKREYKGLDDRVPVTGTEWEYEQALGARERRGGLPDLLVYRSFNKARAEYDRIEELAQMQVQWEALQRFWQRYFQAPDGTFKAAFNRFESLDQFETKLEQHLRELLRRRLPKLPARRPGDRIDWWSGSPYRGLQAFDIGQAAVFFGRGVAERTVTEALVRRAAEGSAFMLVLGASGSGKSSLVRAGILPDLMAPGVVSGVTTWRHAIIQPAELAPDPLAGLAAALLRDDVLPELARIGYRQDEIEMQLRGGPELIQIPLRLALERAAAADSAATGGGVAQGRLILVLDQFEVLLTSAAFTTNTRGALDLLFAKLAQSGLVWIIVTLRSDFYHRMVEFPLLNGLATGLGQYLLAPPSPPEIEQIIRRPAEVAGLQFEVEDESGIPLDAVIRDSAARDPASLPLLSFVLDELYRRDVEANHRNVLSYETYAQLGALEGAIARHAEAMVESLTTEQAAALPALLLALVEIDEIKGTVTARTVRQANLADLRQGELADRLVTERLAVADDKGAGKILRLAHEALLVNWPLLAKLIAEHRDFLVIRRRLQADATIWEDHKRHDDFLLPSGRRIAEAEELLSQRRAELDPEIVAFAESSIIAERERVAAAQRAKEEGLRRDLKRARRFVAVVSVLLLLAVAGGVFAWWESSVATAALAKAEKNYQLALDQAVGNLQLLADEYDAGNISSGILRAVVEHSQTAVSGLPSAGDTDEVTVARVRLLDILSLMEVTLGDTRAMQTAQDENSLADRLKSKDASNLDWLRLWSIARGRWSDILYWQCDCTSAAQRAREGAEGAATVLAAHPDDWFLRRRMLTDYETIGDSLRFMGDLDGTEAAYGAMLKDTQDQLVHEPDAPRWLIFLAFTQERIGDLLAQRGKLAEAAQQYQDDLSVATKLFAQNPRSANFLSAVVQAHQRLGDSWMARNDPAKAVSEYQQYLELGTTLTNIDPSNFHFREIFFAAHQRLGDAYLRQKDYDGALQEFTTYLSLTQDLLKNDPANNFALYDVSNAFQKIGDARLARGDLGGALEAYRQSQALAIQLADKNCQNGSWQKNLAMSYQRIGTVMKAQGNLPGALDQFRRCAAIPVNPAVWSPAALSPQDIDHDCGEEVARLGGAH